MWRSLISVSELIRYFIGCLRTNASREARLVGTRCDQETQTEATMVFIQICRDQPNNGDIFRLEGHFKISWHFLAVFHISEYSGGGDSLELGESNAA